MSWITFHDDLREYRFPSNEIDDEALRDVALYLTEIQRENWHDVSVPSIEQLDGAVRDDADDIRVALYRALAASESAKNPYRFLATHLITRSPLMPEQIDDPRASRTTLRRWHRYLRDRIDGVPVDHIRTFTSTYIWKNIGRRRKSADGRFTKRLSKWLAKECGIKLKFHHIETVGNLTSPERATRYWLRFDRSYWPAEESDPSSYCNGKSCYWSDNYGALDMLHDHDAYALLAYEDPVDDLPYARAWIVEDRGRYIIFNGYNEERKTFCRLLCGTWGGSYKSIDLYNHGETSGLLYINSGAGSCIVPNDDDDIPLEIDLEWNIPDWIQECMSCHSRFPEDDMCPGPAGEGLLCESCYDQEVDHCEYCQDPYWRCDLRPSPEDMPICNDCRNALVTYCDRCGCEAIAPTSGGYQAALCLACKEDDDDDVA